MGYKHLTREQRYTIDALLQTPMSLREIGEVIGVSAGTVSREIRRNCDRRGYRRYRWQLAQKKYERRMKTRCHYLKFTDEMKRTVRRFIVYGQYSPEQICGRFRLKGEEMVCAETIYRWIWQEKPGATTSWRVASGMAGDGNEDVTACTDPGESSRTGLTYR